MRTNIDILFFAVNSHQLKYFKKLVDNLPFKSKLIYFPNFFISLKGLDIIKQIDKEKIIKRAYTEVDIKYKNRLSLYRFLYKKILNIQFLWTTLFIYQFTKKYHPTYIAVWNGKKFHQSIAIEIAKKSNIKSIFFENGILPNTTTIDFKGVNATNSLPKNINFYKKLNYKNKKLPVNLENRKIQNKTKIFFDTNVPKEYIFIPFQVAYDTQIIDHSLWIKNMFDFFYIIKKLSNNIDIHFLIKEHPSDRLSNYKSLYKETTKKVNFINISTQTLIENAKAIITINSSVAIESLLFHKKVIVLGEAFFAIEGIVKVVKNYEELENAIKYIDDFHINYRCIQNFLLYLKNDYLLTDNRKNTSQKHYEEIILKIRKNNDKTII